MTIESASEWIALRSSENLDDQYRASREDAPLEVWLEVLKDDSMSFWVAQNKTIPQEVLFLLADDPDWKVRSMVAAKRKLDPETLSRLAQDPDEGVRRRIAFNLSTPPNVLEQLLGDAAEDIRERARQRLQTES